MTEATDPREYDINPESLAVLKLGGGHLTPEETDRFYELEQIQHVRKTREQMRECRVLYSLLHGLSRADASELATLTEESPRLSPAQNQRFMALHYQGKGLSPAEANDFASLEARKKANADAYCARPDAEAERAKLMMEKSDENMHRSDLEFDAAVNRWFSQAEIARLQAFEDRIYPKNPY